MKKVLVVGDGGVATGFARVLHSIIDNWPSEDYEFYHLAVNYRGDPYRLVNPRHYMYPAMLGGDLYGMNRIQSLLATVKPDLIFILNDLWGIESYLQRLKEEDYKKTVVYFPVDGTHSDEQWLINFGKLGAVVAYTEFGKQEVNVLRPSLHTEIIPHGVDTNIFFPIDQKEARRVLKVIDPNDFVVFNGNRNQPRKRVDLTIEAFAKFAQDKPQSVKLYLHMGVDDSGWNLKKMSRRYGIQDRVIITSENLSPQSAVPINMLNVIYNATDIGLNTSMGEGWGLVNVEHAVTGAAQVVPNSSACTELWNGCGALIDIHHWDTHTGILTRGAVIDTDHAAALLEYLYQNPEARYSLGDAAQIKFSNPKFSWREISKTWLDLFEKVINANNMAHTTGK